MNRDILTIPNKSIGKVFGFSQDCRGVFRSSCRNASLVTTIRGFSGDGEKFLETHWKKMQIRGRAVVTIVTVVTFVTFVIIAHPGCFVFKEFVERS
jgi:hypothetical protein